MTEAEARAIHAAAEAQGLEVTICGPVEPGPDLGIVDRLALWLFPALAGTEGPSHCSGSDAGHEAEASQ
jgi:hypothetical protein